MRDIRLPMAVLGSIFLFGHSVQAADPAPGNADATAPAASAPDGLRAGISVPTSRYGPKQRFGDVRSSAVVSGQADKLICPTGARRKMLSSAVSKNIPVYRNSECADPASLNEGRIAIVTTREAGMRWTRRCRRRTVTTRTVKSCGPGAPKAGAKLAMMLSHRAGDGGKRQGSPGRAPISRKPLRREGRSDVGCTCGHAPFAQFFLARGPRVQRSPGLPCAL
jgi:hypothetical protein